MVHGWIKTTGFLSLKAKTTWQRKTCWRCPRDDAHNKTRKNEKGQRNGQSTKLSVFPQMIQFCFYILPHKRTLAGMSYVTQFCFWSLPHKRTLAGMTYTIWFLSLPHKRALAGMTYMIQFWFWSLPHKRMLAGMTYMTQFSFWSLPHKRTPAGMTYMTQNKVCLTRGR